jgi:hypothetical protein
MNRVLVTVHGAGKNPRSYYEPIIAALTERLGAEPAYRAVWWADLLNIGPPPADLTLLPPMDVDDVVAAQAFRAAFLQELGLEGLGQPVPMDGVLHLSRQLIYDLLDLANDVTAYLFNSRAQALVQSRVLEALDDGADEGEIVLAGHSLGSVILVDVLRLHARRYPVAKLFTLGCPLGKLVRNGIRSSDLGQLSHETVEHWHNVYDDSDPIADVLAPVFPTYEIYDDLVDIGRGVMGSHDYWRSDEVLDLLAEALR